MKQKEYLPGKLCDRVRDLREERGLTRKELAEHSGVNESLLGRIENNKNKKVSDEAVQALAKFFSVSTDFLLGLTDIPDRKNYDIEELGLSIQAARNLYTGAVNVQVVNLLLEDPQFAVLSNHVADFFDETMAAGYAARNQLYASVSEVVGRIGKEDAKLRGAARKTSKIVSAMSTPLYETELIQMQAEFRSIIVRLKKEFPSRVEEMKKLTADYQKERSEFIKNPLIAEFLGVNQDAAVTESTLENAILNHLQKFLMEMGKGYAFVGRQQHIHTEDDDYYIDLVFYNYMLKCFVLIDLKTRKISYEDVGQMDMYLKLYDTYKKTEGDNPTIGIILCSDTNADVARFSTLATNKRMYAAKYLTYIPSKEILAREIEMQKEQFIEQYGNLKKKSKAKS